MGNMWRVEWIGGLGEGGGKETRTTTPYTSHNCEHMFGCH